MDKELDDNLQAILKRFGDDWSEAVLNADIADIKRAFKEAGYVKLEVIEKRIWKSAYISPDNKQKVINGIKQAGGK